MKRFKFRLERLERLRRMARQAAEEAFGAALGRLADCRSRREALERTLEEAEARWHEIASEDGADGNRFRQAALLLDAIRLALVEARAPEREAEIGVEAAEKVLVEKSREHRVLEKLREKRKRRWLGEAERVEQRFLDELHLTRRAAARRDRERR